MDWFNEIIDFQKIPSTREPTYVPTYLPTANRQPPIGMRAKDRFFDMLALPKIGMRAKDRF